MSLKPSVKFDFLQSFIASSGPKRLQKAKVAPEVRELFGTPQIDGRIGALRVEVLGGVSLARQKPDVSVYLVCGDCAYNTDVIQGYRSPMWPNRSRRACVFPLHHAYAKLYAGVFDVRVRKNKENDVYCGRVIVDVAALRSDTEYDVTYPLRASSFIYDRRKRGVLRLRFSVHWFSERAAVLSYLKKPQSTLKFDIAKGKPTMYARFQMIHIALILRFFTFLRS
jgi:hypothetical protein